MRPSLRTGLAILFLTVLSLLPQAGGGQECQNGRISYIFIDNRSIFDLSDLDPDARFRWAYELANSLHMRTREEFIRHELLFKSGECLDSLRLAETERLLRTYPFISQSDVFAIPQPDGTQHVNVYTQDDWTTKLNLGARFDGGFKFNGVEVTEEDFLGRGILARVFYREEEEARDLGTEVQTPRVFNSRWNARFSLGKTRSGSFFEEGLSYPFVGEIGRLAGEQAFVRRENLFAYAISNSAEYTHLLLPFLEEREDLAGGIRLGRPGRLTVLGLGISRESIRFRGFPDDLEYVIGKDFSNTVPVDARGVDQVREQADSRGANRINLLLGQRNLRFIQRRGLDALRGIQDVRVGTEAFVGFGKAFGFLQEGGVPSPHDLHMQLTLFAGTASNAWTMNSQVSLEGRLLPPEAADQARWRDVFGEGDAYLYWRRQPAGPHTLLLRLSAAGGWSLATPFQLTLGGRASVRGYREEKFPGGRRVIFTAEDRIYLPWPAPELFDFGLSVFADLGQIWAGDVPFGVNSGIRGAIGGGIRFGLPPGTSKMARIDIALPIGMDVQPKDIILRITLEELLGLLPGFRDEQLLRSLRSGIRPDIVSTPW